ncbi:MAG: hypothetical protein RIB60_04320 [Phycisphaerales bacterium]
MRGPLCLSALATMAAASVASAQSATVRLIPDSVTIAPGGSATIAVELSFTTGGDPGGAFGPAGLYGFGGFIDASASPLGTSSEGVLANAALTLGRVEDPGDGAALATAAAGLPSGPITTTTVPLYTFDLRIPTDAPAGDFDVEFSGEVVLSLGDELEIFTTIPTPRRGFLLSVPATITVGAACPCDLDANGALNVDDIDTLVTSFLAGDLAVDLDGNGLLNVDDIDAFVACFLAGCG